MRNRTGLLIFSLVLIGANLFGLSKPLSPPATHPEPPISTDRGGPPRDMEKGGKGTLHDHDLDFKTTIGVIVTIDLEKKILELKEDGDTSSLHIKRYYITDWMEIFSHLTGRITALKPGDLKLGARVKVLEYRESKRIVVLVDDSPTRKKG